MRNIASLLITLATLLVFSSASSLVKRDVLDDAEDAVSDLGDSVGDLGNSLKDSLGLGGSNDVLDQIKDLDKDKYCVQVGEGEKMAEAEGEVGNKV